MLAVKIVSPYEHERKMHVTNVVTLNASILAYYVDAFNTGLDKK